MSTKKYHHGNLRSALIDASLQLIQEKGVRALTLREIGAAVGVSRMAPYRHFEDKSALLAAISEAGFLRFGDALLAAKAKAAPDAASQLSAMAVAYVQFAFEHSAYYEVMFSTPASSGTAGQRAFQILHQTIVDGQAAGEIRDGNSLQLARAVWSLVHGISTLRHEGSDPEFVRFCSDVMGSGLLRNSR